MKTNEVLQKQVQDAIESEPSLNTAEIGVVAKEGVVTLTGSVDSYAKKLEAENAAKNIAGVKAIVEKIEIKFNGGGSKGDNEIAREIINAFNWNWAVPDDKIKVKVENGWVTLEGEVKWNYQKETASRVVSNLMGVKGVSNDIVIKSETADQIEKKDIEDALVRNWAIDSENIQVKVVDDKVTLSGTVRSLYQKDEAGQTAWNARGVRAMHNELVVDSHD